MKGGTNTQNLTEIRINTTQDSIGKPQTALKLPENFQILLTAWYYKTAILQLKIFCQTAPKIEQNGVTTNPYAPLHR